VFHRLSGFSTAYVGSSNLTHSAQVTGLEWNVRASAARNPDVLAKFGAVFDSYWAGGDFVRYVPDEFDQERERAGQTDRGPHVILSPIELRPFPFQERLLELIELSRQRGHPAWSQPRRWHGVAVRLACSSRRLPSGWRSSPRSGGSNQGLIRQHLVPAVEDAARRVGGRPISDESASSFARS
jgi:hypothetical protein